MTLPERLAHLPDRKRRELERAAQILFGEFDESLKTKLSEKGRRGRILKLILFGSYARGDWVEDRKSGYRSDYDLLVVVNYGGFAEQYEAWEKAAERFLQELTITRQLSTPVNFIVHTLTDFTCKRPARPACGDGTNLIVDRAEARESFKRAKPTKAAAICAGIPTSQPLRCCKVAAAANDIDVWPDGMLSLPLLSGRRRSMTCFSPSVTK